MFHEHIITTNLEYGIYNFLEQQAKITKKTKKSIIEDALKLYQKYQLKAQIESGLNERYDEYKNNYITYALPRNIQ